MSRYKSSYAMSPQANALPPELVQSIAMALYLERELPLKKPDTAGNYDSIAEAAEARLTVRGWRVEKKLQHRS